jgi:hypothetical protein
VGQDPSGVKQAAEKGWNSRQEPEKHPSVAEASIDFIALVARLKSCPDTPYTSVGVFPQLVNTTVGISVLIEKPRSARA